MTTTDAALTTAVIVGMPTAWLCACVAASEYLKARRTKRLLLPDYAQSAWRSKHK